MLKINLAPEDELQNPLWWVPEVAIMIAVCIAAIYAKDIYLDNIAQKTVEEQSKANEYRQKYQQLKVKVDKFKTLDEEIRQLERKLNALKAITVSKMSRFKSIIVLEHLQNLKPTGVWYESLVTDTAAKSVTLKGEALHYMLVAELMTSIKATGLLERDPADIRSQVFFENIILNETKYIKSSSRFKDLADVRDYSLVFSYAGEELKAKQINEMTISENITTDQSRF